MNKIIKISAISSLLLPVLAFAQQPGGGAQLGNTNNFVLQLGKIVSNLSLVVAGVALLVFFWGLVKFISKSGDDKAEGKSIMVWGVIALFVMVSVWGIINFFYAELGLVGFTWEPNFTEIVPGL